MVILAIGSLLLLSTAPNLSFELLSTALLVLLNYSLRIFLRLPTRLLPTGFHFSASLKISPFPFLKICSIYLLIWTSIVSSLIPKCMSDHLILSMYYQTSIHEHLDFSNHLHSSTTIFMLELRILTVLFFKRLFEFYIIFSFRFPPIIFYFYCTSINCVIRFSLT